jgi:hypothetical protein
MVGVRRTARGGPRLGAGRPRGPQEMVRRHRVTILLTTAERAQLRALARERDLPLGTAAYELVARALARRRRGPA